MKEHIIVLNNQPISYTVIYKNNRKIYLKVQQGKIVVSAPYMTPLSYIEELIYRYQNRLFIQINQYESYQDYKEGGYVDIFSQRYVLCLRDVGKYHCRIHGNKLYVYHFSIEKCVETFLKELLYNYIQERIIFYLAHDFDLVMPEIQIKKYKGRWGSCFYKQNKVTFNLSLVHLDKELIDYVIVHELTHFIEPNHSKRFYKEIEKRMPDYLRRIKILKEKHI